MSNLRNMYMNDLGNEKQNKYDYKCSEKANRNAKNLHQKALVIGKRHSNSTQIYDFALSTVGSLLSKDNSQKLILKKTIQKHESNLASIQQEINCKLDEQKQKTHQNVLNFDKLIYEIKMFNGLAFEMGQTKENMIATHINRIVTNIHSHGKLLINQKIATHALKSNYQILDIALKQQVSNSQTQWCQSIDTINYQLFQLENSINQYKNQSKQSISILKQRIQTIKNKSSSVISNQKSQRKSNDNKMFVLLDKVIQSFKQT